mgnify:CR=1 FL=1
MARIVRDSAPEERQATHPRGHEAADRSHHRESGADLEETERQLDRLARRAGRRDDDDAALRMWSVSVGVGIGREVVVAGGAHGWKKGRAGV